MQCIPIDIAPNVTALVLVSFLLMRILSEADACNDGGTATVGKILLCCIVWKVCIRVSKNELLFYAASWKCFSDGQPFATSDLEVKKWFFLWMIIFQKIVVAIV